MYQSFGHSYLWARADGARLLTYSSPDLSGFYPDKADTSKKGIVTFTGCRGTKLHIEYQDVVLLTISRGGLSL